MKRKIDLFENIKKARISAGISQKELANRLKLSDKAISAYETGRAIPPSPTLYEIAQITQTSLASLLGSETNGSKEDMLVNKLEAILEKLSSIDKELKKINKSNKLA